LTNFKHITWPGQSHIAVGNRTMRLWNILVEAEIQGVKIRGAITVHAGLQEKAEKLAVITFINDLRRIGVWAEAVKVEEPFEVDTGKKNDKGEIITKTEMRTITKYMAPDFNHVKAIDVLALHDYDLTYSNNELIEAAEISKNFGAKSKPRKRTSGEVALDERKKKQKMLAKKEKQLAREKAKKQNAMEKEEMLNKVLEYFSTDKPRKIKDASNDLLLQYQKVRYSLFLIRDKGHNGNSYELVEDEIDGNKAFRLIKK